MLLVSSMSRLLLLRHTTSIHAEPISPAAGHEAEHALEDQILVNASSDLTHSSWAC